MRVRPPQGALPVAPAASGGRALASAAWGHTPLQERLGLGAGPAEAAAYSSTAALARIAFYLLSLGATATLASLAFGVRDSAGVAACAGAAFGLALLCLAGYDRLPEWSFQTISAAASVVVSFGLYFGGPQSTFYQQFYVWVALFAAYHFRPLAAILQVIVIGVAYGLVLGFTDSAAAPVAWFLTIATLLVAGIITVVLHRRVRLQLDELRAQNEQLRDTDRLKDDFLATVSHELRTPLTAIRGYVELLLDESAEQPLGPEQRRFLQVIERNSDRLLRQVNDILVVAQIEAGALAIDALPVDLAQIAAEAVSRHLAIAQECGLELSGDTLAPNTTVIGDEARLAQLLDVLIENAIKFTPSGGTVGVYVRPLADTVELEVVDSGCGISSDEQPRLFERFYRARGVTAEAVPGTGIGLTIALGIVERHGGTIQCASRVDRGSTFRVVLPVSGRA